MGAFSADRSAMMNALSGYTDVLRRRKDALTAIQLLSGELLEKLVAGDVESLNETLDRRERACAVLARTMAGATELPDLIEQARRSSQGRADDSVGRVLGLDDEIKRILADVVEKQRQCEEILKADIASTAEQLRQSAKKRQLNTAYGPANARPQARFVDRMR